MTFYLMTNVRSIRLQPSAYRGFLKDCLGDAHYSDGMLKRCHPVPDSAPPDCKYAYQVDGFRDANDFTNAHTRWLHDSLTLHRGISGCHFALPRMTQGDLVSEGPHDVPVATMGAAPGAGTRWLPFAHDEGVGQAPAFNHIDPYTRSLALHHDVPVGFMLSTTVGLNLGRPIAWLNDCEQLVKGPLVWGGFTIRRVAWLARGQRIGFTNWPMGFSHRDLPPARPYEPGNAVEIQNWWHITTDWVNNLRLAGHLAGL